MATIVRRRSVGLPMDSTMASSGYLRSPADPHAFPGGRRLGNFGRPQIKKERTSKSSFKVLALIILACLCTWLAVQYYASRPAKDEATTPEYPEIQQLLKDATRGLNGLFVVFVSIYNGETTRVYQGKSEASAFEAFSKAMNLHTTQQTLPETLHSWMKIDVVDRVERIDHFDFSETFHSQVGDRTWYYGFALDWDANWAFLPEEVWANNMVDGNTNAFRWDNIISYLKEKDEKENQDTMDWNLFSRIRDLESPTLRNGLDVFYTSSYFVDMSVSEEIIPVYHGHRLFDKGDIAPALLTQAARAAGDYLTQSIQTDDDGKLEQGQMTYQYNPRTDQESDPFFRYNLPRHAGALYSLSRLLNHKKDPALIHSIQLGLDWLLNKHLKECHVPDKYQTRTRSVTKCVVQDVRDEEGEISVVAKLGINSLTLLAISEFVAAFRNFDKSREDQSRIDRYMGIARGLADFIQSNQRPDGSLTQVVHLYPERESDETFPRYYQGEVTFALSRFYTVSGLMGREQKSEWLDVAEAAAGYAVEDQWDVSDTDFEDDHWLLYGMAELHRCGRRLKPRFVDFAMRVANVVATHQYTENNGEYSHTLDLLDWVGIPDELSNSAVSAAMKSEGLCAIYDVAIEYHKEESGMILDTVFNSVLYQLKSQYGPELAMYMRNPIRILGGMREGVDSLVMRSDYSQHNLSSFLCLAKLLEARQYRKQRD